MSERGKPNERPKDDQRAQLEKSGLKEEKKVQGPKPEGISSPEGDEMLLANEDEAEDADEQSA